jgi:hypothetical protein
MRGVVVDRHKRERVTADLLVVLGPIRLIVPLSDACSKGNQELTICLERI